MGEWKSLKIDSGTGWKEIYRDAGSGWKALEWTSAYEDFTTFTEVDPNSHISVASATHIDSAVCRNEDAYLYKDYGANYFGNFTHNIDAKTISWANGNSGTFWMISDYLDDRLGLLNNNHPYVAVLFYRSSTQAICYLEEGKSDGTKQTDLNTALSDNTMYYFVIEKNGTTMTCKIYSNAARTTLVDTLTLTLDANYTLKYLYAVNVRNGGQAPCCNQDIENLDLNG